MCTLVTLQYIPRNMHTVFALLCFVVVIHWLIFPYPSGLLHWHCGNLTIAPVPAKQPWWIWINTSCEFIMNDCITTTKQSTTKPCAYFLGYTVYVGISCFPEDIFHYFTNIHEACFIDIVVKSIFSAISNIYNPREGTWTEEMSFWNFNHPYGYYTGNANDRTYQYINKSL